MDEIKLEPKQLEGKPRRVGRVGNDPVFEAATRGGLHMLVKLDRGARKTKLLGAGPHPAVARHIARKSTKGLVLDALQKSEVTHEVMRGLETGRRWTAYLQSRGL